MRQGYADGSRVLTASFDYSARLWQFDEQRELALLDGHDGPVNDVDFLDGTEQALTAGADGKVILWDVAGAKPLAEVQGHSGRAMAVAGDAAGCTLCLACVGACPAGAIRDNPESPEINFTEQLCVQCGLCQNTCPEKVITLEPRYNFSKESRDALVLHQEEPFECIRCGKPFGVQSTIERIVEQLAGKHSMFQGEGAADIIKMCDTCRVNVQFKDGAFNQGVIQRRPIRNTEDDLREREERRAQGLPEEED